MKINKILLILVMGTLLISCGGKTKGNETSAEGDALTESDCQCADLNLVTKDADGKDVYNFKDIKKNGSNELFIGTCIEKDQNDSIIKTVEIKNGFVIRQILREKVGKIYATNYDMTYENLEKANGFSIVISEEDNIAGSNIKYVGLVEETKNGREFIKYDVNLQNSFNEIRISYSPEYVNGKRWSKYEENVPPKSMVNANLDYDGSYVMQDISPEQFYKTLEDMKKEFKHFNYWKVD
ncbi:MAG: hypothetical protein EAZ75_08980 [Flavobacteriia bacterium]|jgi:hypothetical protein|nr:MAG: hypothetical protein EAZ75_08980 [Flavobacteriia bacterium]